MSCVSITACSHKKDEFFLNRKHVNKSEIVSLLETAGFSKSNPYYIVQQGKVANLCTMNDRARLNLLKEVAGTTVYEERRQESVKIMEKSLTEQSKINEVLDYLNERLSELDAEKSELVEYEKLDRQRRALEFNLYDKEFRDAQAKLEEIEAQREALREQQIALHTQLRDIQDEAAGEEDSLATVKSAHERLRARRDAKNDETTALETKKAELDVQIQDLQEKVNTKSSVLTTTRQQLLELDGVIAQRRRQIEEMSPQIAALIDRRQAEIDELGQIRKRMEIFYAKQGRGQQFSSKAERDRFLQAQIDTLAEQAKKNESIVARKAADFEREGTAIQLERSELAAIESQNAQRTREYDALGKQLREQTLQVNQLIEQRKNNWREIEALRDGIREAEQEAERGKQQLSKTLPRSISDGLKTVEFLVQQRNIRGYFGPLIDNISLKSDAFRAAVEVAAGNNLFNVVVDTDETAAILIKELERAKVGRLTFLPLNRIRTHTFRYPDPTEKEVHPLIQVALEYDPEIEAAVKLIFGAKLIARNIDVASRFAREFNMDAITMEGDVAYSRGNLEGGFHDDRVSRIAAVFKIRQATERLTQLKAQVETLSTQATKVDSQVNELRSSNQKLEVERQQLHNLTEQQTKEQASRAKKLAVAEQALVQGRQEIHNLEKEIDSIREQSETYHREMQTALTQRLTDAERSELRGLEERLRLLQAQHEDTKKEVSILVNDRDQVKIELENGLVKRKEELSLTIKLNSTVEGSEAAAATATGSVDLESALESLQVESAHVAVSLVTSQRALQEMQEAVEVRLRELQHLEGSLEEKKEAEKQLLLQLTALAAEIDRLVNQRSTFMDTMESRQRLIRDLGAIPSKEQAEYQNMKVTQLNRLLKDVQEDLKQFSAVNRKALDQYVSFSEQRETLLQRKSEIDRDAQAITALIDSLDNQKNEAIMRTFTGVSKHFAAVFGELVPGGRGQLIMRTTHDVPDESSAAAASSEAATAEDELEGHVLDNEDNLGATSEGGKLSVAQFKGVEVSVSFTGVGQHYTMQQLSGGQKTLVALAIIFAIQRCDPAPFYLFDEIDSALDANYRMAVARLIHRQATAETSGTQFITTTFRPELVTVADKFFGIKLENKSSNLIPLTKVRASRLLRLQNKTAVKRTIQIWIRFFYVFLFVFDVIANF